ncbi:unnamed protein product [Menidia menidia]|uniref:(Atlantic silverside) hypothetical protein n=1 Tax=Menidia menidia TaxID=238744 RepID=A0A8S4BJ92_9TELE|nr:unnamed protein product [Menidia menidia]
MASAESCQKMNVCGSQPGGISMRGKKLEHFLDLRSSSTNTRRTVNTAAVLLQHTCWTTVRLVLREACGFHILRQLASQAPFEKVLEKILKEQKAKAPPLILIQPQDSISTVTSGLDARHGAAEGNAPPSVASLCQSQTLPRIAVGTEMPGVRERSLHPAL